MFALLAVLFAGDASADTTICTVHHSTEVRYRGLGYQHIVHITNSCDEAVACEVRTSASHGHVDVTVPGRSSVAVLTRRGAASRKFTAQLSCHPKAS